MTLLENAKVLALGLGPGILVSKENRMANLLENCKRLDYDPDQPRDENGRWSEVEGRSTLPAGAAETKTHFETAHTALSSARTRIQPVVFKGRLSEAIENNEIKKGPSGKDMYRYSSHVSMRDLSGANTVSREVSGPQTKEQVHATVREMHKELTEQTKAMKARIRAERSFS